MATSKSSRTFLTGRKRFFPEIETKARHKTCALKSHSRPVPVVEAARKPRDPLTQAAD